MKRQLNIGFCYDVAAAGQGSLQEENELAREFDSPETIEKIVQALKSAGHQVKLIGPAAELLRGIRDLDVDIVFNLSEGMHSRNRESFAPILLELQGIPYVGSDGLTMGLSLDKLMAKKIMSAYNILTPRFISLDNISSLNKPLPPLAYPLIIKPRYEGSAIGISPEAIVDNLAALKRRADFVIQRYKQPALAEEFIFGAEFTVAIIGNGSGKEVLPVVQREVEQTTTLSAHIFSGQGGYSFRRFHQTDPKLEQRISEIAAKIYDIFGCRDFGRIDFRVDEKKNIYTLELNPLPSLASDDTFALLAQCQEMDYTGHGGYASFAGMINKILTAALLRYNMI